MKRLLTIAITAGLLTSGTLVSWDALGLSATRIKGNQKTETVKKKVLLKSRLRSLKRRHQGKGRCSVEKSALKNMDGLCSRKVKTVNAKFYWPWSVVRKSI